MSSLYWLNKDDVGEYYMFYVDDEKAQKKIKQTPCAIYSKNKKQIAVQYKVDKNSKDSKELFKLLNPKEMKAKKERRTTKK